MEDFDNTVELYSKAFANSGYNYNHAKTQLLEFRDKDPVELIKKQGDRKTQRRNRKG